MRSWKPKSTRVKDSTQAATTLATWKKWGKSWNHCRVRTTHSDFFRVSFFFLKIRIFVILPAPGDSLNCRITTARVEEKILTTMKSSKQCREKSTCDYRVTRSVEFCRILQTKSELTPYSDSVSNFVNDTDIIIVICLRWASAEDFRSAPSRLI